ncbi:MAG: mannonate dehydratase [Segetibacter sp.]|nr:mannonate dehydratase [Segetibacter sp.]
MKDNRRDFIKKGSSLAAALSMGGIKAAQSFASGQKAAASNVEASGWAKDAGMKFGLAMGLESPRVPFAKQMDVLHAVTGVKRDPDLKPWDPKAITATKEAWESLGMKWTVVEGPPALGEQTKLSLAGRDEEIANFITFMKNLKQYGNVDVICYNWMPVISWFRSKMDSVGRGGALVTSFDYNDIKDAPLTQYGVVTKETLWKNLEYFLKAVVPEAEKIGMNLSLHPDDPQVDSIKGISRIMTSVENFDRMLNLVPSKYSGLTMCQGNFALMGADIPSLVRRWGKRGVINFVHFRNVRELSHQVPSVKFTECFHDEGQIDMYKAMEAYYDIGFKGTIRPDHVPTMAGDSNDRPGYSTIGALFAIGYMRGLIETISKKGNKA